MSPRQFSRTLILFLLLAGCGVRQEATTASEDRDRETEQRQGYRVYRTPDTKAWSRYRLPLDIEIKTPEVPKEILGPSAPIQGKSSGGENPSAK